MNATSNEPWTMLAWDIREKNGTTSAVVHYGTKASVAALKKCRTLPTQEEVRARAAARQQEARHD